MLAATLLGAGTDTTRNQLAAAVQVLADHPDQWALLAAHPELAPNAVHELMRYCPIIFAVARKAAEDVELAACTIPAGTTVGANTASANRDPAVYRDPDRLDITRDDPPAMLTFGGGAHYCLGTHLAHRAHRSPADHHPAHAQPAPHPTRVVEGDDRNSRPDQCAARVRYRTLNAVSFRRGVLLPGRAARGR